MKPAATFNVHRATLRAWCIPVNDYGLSFDGIETGHGHIPYSGRDSIPRVTIERDDPLRTFESMELRGTPLLFASYTECLDVLERLVCATAERFPMHVVRVPHVWPGFGHVEGRHPIFRLHESRIERVGDAVSVEASFDVKLVEMRHVRTRGVVDGVEVDMGWSSERVPVTKVDWAPFLPPGESWPVREGDPAGRCYTTRKFKPRAAAIALASVDVGAFAVEEQV